MAARPGSNGIISGRYARILPLAAAIAVLVQLFAASSAPFLPPAADAHAARAGNVVVGVPPGTDFLSVALLPALVQEPGDAEPSPALEFIRQMTALDVLFVLLWLGAVVLGIATGVIRQLILIISLLVGGLVGAILTLPTANFTGPFTGSTRDAALPATYFILVIVSVTAIYFFSTRIYPETRLGKYWLIDRLGGVVLGFVTGLIAISLLVGMLLILTSREWASMESTRTNMRAQLTTTPFLPVVAATFPLVTQTIANTLPLPIKDMCERCL